MLLSDFAVLLAIRPRKTGFCGIHNRSATNPVTMGTLPSRKASLLEIGGWILSRQTRFRSSNLKPARSTKRFCASSETMTDGIHILRPAAVTNSALHCNVGGSDARKPFAHSKDGVVKKTCPPDLRSRAASFQNPKVPQARHE